MRTTIQWKLRKRSQFYACFSNFLDGKQQAPQIAEVFFSFYVQQDDISDRRLWFLHPNRGQIRGKTSEAPGVTWPQGWEWMHQPETAWRPEDPRKQEKKCSPYNAQVVWEPGRARQHVRHSVEEDALAASLPEIAQVGLPIISYNNGSSDKMTEGKSCLNRTNSESSGFGCRESVLSIAGQWGSIAQDWCTDFRDKPRKPEKCQGSGTLEYSVSPDINQVRFSSQWKLDIEVNVMHS